MRAFPVYGYARATLDIDIFIRPTRLNAERTRKALSEFGYDIAGISVDDLLTKKVLIRQYMVETDIHPFVKGRKFEQVWKNRVKAKIGNTFVFFSSLNDLIGMKKAAGRARDLEDLKYLIKLKRKFGKSR